MAEKQESKQRFNQQLIREMGSTYEDYAAVPEDMGRFELLDGELLAMSPAPAALHQFVSKELQKALYACDVDYFILNSPIDVILSAHSVLQPDIVILQKTRGHFITMKGVEGPPDVVVEILSPSTAGRDRGKKMHIYAHYGVPEYWIVDSRNEVLEQYLLATDHFDLHRVYLGENPVQSLNIPCVSFTMADIMAHIPHLE